MIEIKSPKDVYDLVKGGLIGQDVEHCFVLTLLKNTVKSLHWVSLGSEDACVFPVKVIARHAINDLASGVVLIHNHPSGDPTPSNADMNQTEQMTKFLAALDIKLMDHIILGDNSYFAFSEGRIVKTKNNGK